jgi:hypothetical protein
VAIWSKIELGHAQCGAALQHTARGRKVIDYAVGNRGSIPGRYRDFPFRFHVQTICEIRLVSSPTSIGGSFPRARDQIMKVTTHSQSKLSYEYVELELHIQFKGLLLKNIYTVIPYSSTYYDMTAEYAF